MSMNLTIAFIVAIAGYLIGSIAFTRVLGYWLAPGELKGGTTAISWGEEKGFVAENISATTLAQRRGPRFGCLAASLDILKAVIPVLLLRILYPDQLYAVVAATTILIGHNYPLYYRFKGGRGTSVVIGSLLVLAPLSLPVTIIAGNLIGLFVFKDVLLAHHAGWFLLLPVWFALTGRWDLFIYSLIVNIVRWSASIDEIKTYLAYRRSGELQTREFHEAIEKTHIGYFHRFLRRRGWLKYPYMEQSA